MPPGSVVRTIWADPDVVLLIFAGSSAEFAVNRAVDWLFVTGHLPRDPLGRLFSTVHYARQILFATADQAQRTITAITAAHAAVERRRGERIPDWAHRDVLYMLIDQSQRAYGLLHEPLTAAQQEDLYATFLELGRGLNIPDLPQNFVRWEQDRESHLERDLTYSEFTERLYQQYRLHLGAWRYRLLLEVQALLVPPRVRDLLRLKPGNLAGASLDLYSLVGPLGIHPLVRRALVPRMYWSDIGRLEDGADTAH